MTQSLARTLGKDRAGKILRDLERSFGPSSTPFVARPSRRPASVLTAPWGAIRLPAAPKKTLNRLGGFDILLDRARERLDVQGREVSLEGREVLVKLVATLIRAGGRAVPFEELFPAVWERPYNPAYDDGTIYFNVNRLRRLIEQAVPDLEPFEACGLSYRVAPGLKFAMVEAVAVKKGPRRGRSALMDLLAERSFIDNRAYCRLAGISASTALRELRDLVAEGTLVREGSGRGARYRLGRPAFAHV